MKERGDIGESERERRYGKERYEREKDRGDMGRKREEIWGERERRYGKEINRREREKERGYMGKRYIGEREKDRGDMGRKREEIWERDI